MVLEDQKQNNQNLTETNKILVQQLSNGGGIKPNNKTIKNFKQK